MAGAEGIEPSSKVLETPIVTIGPRAYIKMSGDDTLKQPTIQVFF